MTRFLHSSTFHKQIDGCPQAGWLYQTGAPKAPAAEHFRFGITAHLVMQNYVDHCVANGRRTDTSVIGEFIDAAVLETHLPVSRYDELTLMLRTFLDVYEVDLEHSIEREGGIAFAEDLSIRPWSEDYDYDRLSNPMAIAATGIMLRLRLDETLVFPEESRLLVRDFKTDVYVPSQSEVDDPTNRFHQQARKYAWAGWRKYFRADVIDVEFPFMRRVAYGRAATRRLTFTKADILEIEAQELAKIGLVEKMTEFPARPGDRCHSCAYRETACPVPLEKTSTDPAAVARVFLFTRVEQEIRRERIKEFVAEYGWTGEVGVLRSEFEQDEAPVPDMKRVWTELKDVGLEEPWRVMSFSKTDAKKFLDKDVFERVVASAYDPQIITKFNLHQGKEELQKLAIERGISTQTMGKKGMKDKTIAQLAWDLAQYEGDAGEPSRSLASDLEPGITITNAGELPPGVAEQAVDSLQEVGVIAGKFRLEPNDPQPERLATPLPAPRPRVVAAPKPSAPAPARPSLGLDLDLEEVV